MAYRFGVYSWGWAQGNLDEPSRTELVAIG